MAVERPALSLSRRRFVWGAGIAGLGLLAGCGWLRGPGQPTRIHRIGWLSNSPVAENVEAVREGLQELGYVEGQNLIVERRTSERPIAEAGEYAAELVALGVDLILTTGTFTAEAARAATDTIPIVMVYPGNPVGAG